MSELELYAPVRWAAELPSAIQTMRTGEIASFGGQGHMPRQWGSRDRIIDSLTPSGPLAKAGAVVGDRIVVDRIESVCSPQIGQSVGLTLKHAAVFAGTVLALPACHRGTLNGFVLLGAKPKGDGYRPDELEVLAFAVQQVGPDLHALQNEALRGEIESFRGEVMRAKTETLQARNEAVQIRNQALRQAVGS